MNRRIGRPVFIIGHERRIFKAGYPERWCMAALKNKFNSWLVTMILTVFFLVAVFYSLTAYDRFQKMNRKHELLSTRVNALIKNKRDAERNRSIHASVNRFVEKTRALGLEKDKWSILEVNLDTKVTFEEIAHLISQCSHSSTYYFRPGELDLTSGSSKAETTPHEPASRGAGWIQDAQSQNASPSDMQLTLKGAFIMGPTHD
jgi:hypothetical protein